MDKFFKDLLSEENLEKSVQELQDAIESAVKYSANTQEDHYVVDTSHYDKFNVKLTDLEIQTGIIRLDPYRVAKEWGLGQKDDSGCLFHILKTIARFGDKKGNSIRRELGSLRSTITRFEQLLINKLNPKK